MNTAILVYRTARVAQIGVSAAHRAALAVATVVGAVFVAALVAVRSDR